MSDLVSIYTRYCGCSPYVFLSLTLEMEVHTAMLTFTFFNLLICLKQIWYPIFPVLLCEDKLGIIFVLPMIITAWDIIKLSCFSTNSSVWTRSTLMDSESLINIAFYYSVTNLYLQVVWCMSSDDGNGRAVLDIMQYNQGPHSRSRYGHHKHQR